MRKIKSFQFLAILFCLGLGSCASVKDVVNPYDEEFHCRAKDTEGKCVDTPTAYQDARFPQPAVESNADAEEKTPTLNVPSKAEAKASQYKAIAELLDNPETPLLNPPKVLRVLILPYKGEKNELFMTRYAYLEIEKAAWVLTDIKEK
jgi:conjugal transfer pilus assembly protein TraV